MHESVCSSQAVMPQGEADGRDGQGMCGEGEWKGGAQSVHLLPERLRAVAEEEHGAVRGTAEAACVDPLVIQPGVNHLVQKRGRRPRLVSRAPQKLAGVFGLQQVMQNGGPCLLLVCPGEGRAWVNGTPAPSIVLLADGDEVQFDPHSPFLVHVTVFSRVYIGPARAREAGRDCRFCRTSFLPGSRVYVCHSCGQPLHLEGDERPEDERLQCALLCSVCPSCEAPILKTSGYRSLPEFCKPRDLGMGRGT
jgi:hypothetical protein